MKWLVQDSSFMLSLAMCFMIGSGPIEAPTRHPVIANFLKMYIKSPSSFHTRKLTIDLGDSSEY